MRKRLSSARQAGCSCPSSSERPWDTGYAGLYSEVWMLLSSSPAFRRRIAISTPWRLRRGSSPNRAMKIHGIAVGSVPFSNTLRLRYEQGGRRGMVQVVDGRQMRTCFNLGRMGRGSRCHSVPMAPERPLPHVFRFNLPAGTTLLCVKAGKTISVLPTVRSFGFRVHMRTRWLRRG